MSGAVLEVPADPRMGVTLRAFVTAVANDLGAPAEDLALAVSELLGSAIEGGSRRLRIELLEGLRHHRPAPNHRGVDIDEEADRDRLDAVAHHRLERLPVLGQRRC